MVDRTNKYGTFYRVEGIITRVNNRNLAVITIWLQRKADNQTQFITLIPLKR
ncbi:DUF6883 domain-containing protein [Okeania sp.]|uniref:DUF6883 domain-containing protein n=1 Tax=Okeania sp. TaxID=3100323 RepID=UPI002B4B749A|nr:DUF6883 domain-containing protein [Okeania sp.]MEB3339567.1 hypothetical protein [Okeania sp.]